jgi:hypothetical protein
MKTSLFAFALLGAAALATAAPNGPTLPADQALALAQQHLNSRAASAGFYITSLKLETLDLKRSAYRWAVEWSEPVPVDSTKKETGIEIAMDGSIVSLVKGPPNRNPRTGKFDPNGSTGLQNPRTRSDRPSILDLKH